MYVGDAPGAYVDSRVGTAPLGMPIEMLASGGTLYAPVPIAEPAAAALVASVAAGADVVDVPATAAEVVAATDRDAAAVDVAWRLWTWWT